MFLAGSESSRNMDVDRVPDPEVEALWPTTRGLRHPKRMYDSADGDVPEGQTPWTLPARNKAGRLRVDQSLESVETPRRHLNLEDGFFQGLCGCPLLQAS